MILKCHMHHDKAAGPQENKIQAARESNMAVQNLPVLHTIFFMSTLIQHCDVVLMLNQGLLGPGCLVY